MALAGTTVTTRNNSSEQNGYLIPLILVTSLFFLWGMAYGLLDVLNKHFQETLNVTKSRSTLLQAAYFGAYFLVALPAGLFMNKYGYKKGIILGLILYAIGAFLFYPAAEQMSFNFFLFATFVIASGLTCLETAANPYVTVLGPPETGTFRLNLSQCFNGVGAFLGPLIAASLFFSGNENDGGELDTVKLVYIIIGAVVLVVAGFFFRTPLPEIRESELTSSKSLDKKPLIEHCNFVYGVFAQFFYVAAQVGIAALFINYCTESGNGIRNDTASYLLSISLMLFTVGRFAGTALMRKFAPSKLLMMYAIFNVVLCFIVAFVKGWVSIYSLMTLFFFQSIMFPTIFALAVKDLGHHTKKGSSFLIMSIVGGACMPYVMGLVAERYSTASSYLIPMLCFICVAWYGWKGYKVRS
ncbi:MAG TPA: sugar MFS transporter [Flavitalea sp.]|nr:sugar MFS transporter [Flavitalea sp.]